jgi:uncharacterized protein (UPF0332 family)
MSLASDLLDQASTLASMDPMKPKQASLRRAISEAYYSIFHLLIDEAARRISTNAALQPYIARSFDHKNLKEAANKIIAYSSPQPPWPGPLLSTPIEAELVRVCNAFVDLQSLRHQADYNIAKAFMRADVVIEVSRAKAAHQDWAQTRTSDNVTVFLLLSAKLLPDK